MNDFHLSRTIFVGDLSIHCTEDDICRLFSPFGKIESISLKRVQEGKNSFLFYGFIKYEQRSCGETAIAAMNGKLLLGRPLRLGWASEVEDKRGRRMDRPVTPPRAQVHVAFQSKTDVPISESLIRFIFEKYGEVVDVVIKKLNFNKEMHEQSGYGFVHFPLNEAGVEGAINAVQHLNEAVSENVYLRCSVSHGLTEHLKARGLSPPASSPAFPVPPRPLETPYPPIYTEYLKPKTSPTYGGMHQKGMDHGFPPQPLVHDGFRQMKTYSNMQMNPAPMLRMNDSFLPNNFNSGILPPRNDDNRMNPFVSFPSGFNSSNSSGIYPPSFHSSSRSSSSSSPASDLLFAPTNTDGLGFNNGMKSNNYSFPSRMESFPTNSPTSINNNNNFFYNNNNNLNGNPELSFARF